MDRTEVVARLWAEHQALAEMPTFHAYRTGLLGWRWHLVLYLGDDLLDETVCLTRRGAGRKGRRWVREERERMDRDMLAVLDGLE